MQLFFSFFFLILKLYNSQQNENFTFEEAIDVINKENNLTKDKYDQIKSLIINNIKDKYVYLDIIKKPPIKDIPEVDLIKELEEIDTKNIKYYDFFKKISSSLCSVLDINLFILFNKLINFQYFLPFDFHIKNENNSFYLYYTINNRIGFYKDNLKNKIIENSNKIIESINEKNPFDYIENFGKNVYKSRHAQYNLKFSQITLGNLARHPFEISDLKDILFTFNDGTYFEINHTIIKLKQNNFNNLQTISYNELIKHKNEINSFDSYLKKNNINKGNDIKVKDIQWDLNYLNLIKYKKDKENELNVIYQRSFKFMNPLNLDFTEDIFIFFKNLTKFLNDNEYPIAVIEDFNQDGSTFFSSLLQKVLNFNIINTKTKLSIRINDNIKKELKKLNNYYNIETCKSTDILSEIKTDKYSNEISHNRTKIFTDTNYYIFNKLLEDIKIKERKPTEIIIFTDGSSYGPTSFFIKDLQESGNAIIVGYNGNPSNEKKNDKFDSSQSPSIPVIINDKILQENNIYLSISNYESFDDSYQDKNNIIIPREYKVNKIDERSLIYGKYDDNRYIEFVNETKRIINKYKKECNKDNIKLLLFNEICVNETNYSKGGFVCGENGLWTQKCEYYYCFEGYYYDNFNKVCKRDLCYSNGKFKDGVFIFLIILSIVILILLVLSLGYVCWFKINLKKGTNYVLGNNLIEEM